MINVKTLAPHYPREFSQLSATQWVSLHMCLHRPPGDDPSPDPLFGAYISVLPRDFASHPVVWMVKQDLRQNGFDTELLDHLPPTTLAALKRVCSKFWEDWDAVCKSMVTSCVDGTSFASHSATSHEIQKSWSQPGELGSSLYLRTRLFAWTSCGRG